MIPLEQTKKCNVCGQTKEINCFREADNIYGRRTDCRICENIENKKRIKKYKKYRPWIFHLYSSRAHCKDKNHSYGKREMQNTLTAEQIKTLWFRDEAHKMEAPSIDRINSSLGYFFENCRFIEFDINMRLPRYGYEKRDKKRWPSKNDTVKERK